MSLMVIIFGLIKKQINMKKIKKFEEYELDVDGGEIAQEYAKLIISTYIDRTNETIESVYAEVIKGDQLDEDQAYIIKQELQDYLYNLYEESSKIRKIIDIDAKKYNL